MIPNIRPVQIPDKFYTILLRAHPPYPPRDAEGVRVGGYCARVIEPNRKPRNQMGRKAVGAVKVLREEGTPMVHLRTWLIDKAGISLGDRAVIDIREGHLQVVAWETGTRVRSGQSLPWVRVGRVLPKEDPMWDLVGRIWDAEDVLTGDGWVAVPIGGDDGTP